METRDVCPRCGRKDLVIPVVWGYPAPETQRRVERGELALGGCCADPGAPERYCRRCGIAFGGEVPPGKWVKWGPAVLTSEETEGILRGLDGLAGRRKPGEPSPGG